jgi:hypothetical protein
MPVSSTTPRRDRWSHDFFFTLIVCSKRMDGWKEGKKRKREVRTRNREQKVAMPILLGIFNNLRVKFTGATPLFPKRLRVCFGMQCHALKKTCQTKGAAAPILCRENYYF